MINSLNRHPGFRLYTTCTASCAGRNIKQAELAILVQIVMLFRSFSSLAP
ncbi:hypothetical protein ASAC_1444 [Acidilobus saccharovorans 345-15]|uniref:Uncharacterized protein n=1 Tax=Acidilobus saccharovorans (strain DSM 16705 / JCM 18335 / VKM B-2471 / 345-15) TaxID=666510 RepID=D9PZ62_ACIS3|nr:hypothetical protein ASAC_1444 [Acidilobus saccharovorans 345-15]